MSTSGRQNSGCASTNTLPAHSFSSCKHKATVHLFFPPQINRHIFIKNCSKLKYTPSNLSTLQTASRAFSKFIVPSLETQPGSLESLGLKKKDHHHHQAKHICYPRVNEFLSVTHLCTKGRGRKLRTEVVSNPQSNMIVVDLNLRTLQGNVG